MQVRVKILLNFSGAGLDVARDVEIILVLFYLGISDQATEVRLRSSLCPSISNTLDVLLAEAVFRAIFVEAIFCVNHKDAFRVVLIWFIQDDDASRNASSVEEVCRKTDDAFDHVALDEALAELGFCVSFFHTATEENAMRKNTSTFATLDD